MKKLCFVATIPAVVHSFLKEHIRASAEKWSVRIISNPDGSELLNNLDAQFIPLVIERKPSPWRDLCDLIQLVILFHREHCDLVHSITPKAGLLSMMAAWLVGVPNRMHTFTGQVWANKRGWQRSALKLFDKMIALFATHILVDSPSQRDFLVAEGILLQGKGIVLGQGSICGVDECRFHPDVREREAVRAELGISPEQTVILFLGRLNRDKGILDLVAAFTHIASIRDDVVLVLVGAEEDITYTHVQEICGEYRGRLHRVSFTPTPERYMAATDIFCLPSYREGFGQVIIEAAASGVPTAASRIYGITDAVDDGKTGLLFPAGDVAALTQSLSGLIEDQALRQKMGEAARERALKFFSSVEITGELQDLYDRQLGPRTKLMPQQGLQSAGSWFGARDYSVSGIRYLKKRSEDINGGCNHSVVIVNYNAGDVLLECVARAQQQAEQVIVVDNASTDGSIAALRNAFPKVRLICNEQNLGFAVACNHGAVVADGNHILFLNPDCILEPNAIQNLTQALNSAPDVGMVGGLLINPDGTEQVGGRRTIPTPWSSFVRVFGLNKLRNHNPRLFSDFSLHLQPLPEHPLEVEAISGACMLVRRDALEEVGLLDEGYFMHCEDLDWCMRFHHGSWKVLFVPDARMVHYKGHCSKSRPIFVEWNKHKGMMRFYRKFFRNQYPGPLMYLVALGVWMRFCMLVLLYPIDRLTHGFQLSKS